MQAAQDQGLLRSGDRLGAGVKSGRQLFQPRGSKRETGGQVFPSKRKPNRFQAEGKLGEAAESRGPGCHLHKIKGWEGSARRAEARLPGVCLALLLTSGVSFP